MTVKGLLIALSAVFFLGCAVTGPPPGTVAMVNGEAAPRIVYDILVQAAQTGMQRAGVPLRQTDVRKTKIEAAALKGAVHDSVVAQLARKRKVTANDQEVDAALSKLEAALGGPANFDQRLESSGVDRQQYRILYHYTLLEQKMRAVDSDYDKTLAKAIKDAKVEAYVGPCSTEHEYPKCLGLTG